MGIIYFVSPMQDSQRAHTWDAKDPCPLAKEQDIVVVSGKGLPQDRINMDTCGNAVGQWGVVLEEWII
jgi:hypothetical protein